MPIPRPGAPDAGRAAMALAVVLLAAPAAFVLVDFAVASARGWSLNNGFDRTFVIGSIVVLVLLAAALALRPGRALLRRHAARLVLLLTSMLLCFALAEIVLGVIVHPAASYQRFHRMAPHHHYVSHPDPAAVPGVSGPAHYRTDASGLRAPPRTGREEAFRIVCIGGSTTICTYLDDSEIWSQRLMDRLNEGATGPGTWVGNAGHNGYSTRHHLHLLADRAFLAEMDAAIFLVGANDLLLALSGGRVKIQVAPPPLWRRARSVNLLATGIALLGAAGRGDVDDEVGHNLVRHRRARQEARKVDALPDLGPALDGYAERLREMVRMTRAAGVLPIFLTQPVLWSASPSPRAESLMWLGRMRGGGFLSVPLLREGMDRYNARLREVGAELGVLVIDLSRMSGQEPYFYDDCHFTEAGADELARLVAGALRDAGAVPPADTGHVVR